MVFLFGAFQWPFSIFGVQNRTISRCLCFADFGLWFWGFVCGESVPDLAPPFGGDIDLNVRDGTCPLWYTDLLPNVD